MDGGAGSGSAGTNGPGSAVAGVECSPSRWLSFRCRLTDVIREGSGAGHGIDADLGQAHESAIKEAETDAMKRALMTFGNPFGLALYDKQQREVTSSSASTSARHSPAPQCNSAAAEPMAEMGLEPLDPATIQQILATVRGLPRPALGSPRHFASASRYRQMPPRSPIGSARGGTTTGSRRFWSRTGRCAQEISARQRLKRLCLSTIGPWPSRASVTIPP